MRKRNTDKEKKVSSEKFTLKYQKPKILLIYLSDKVLVRVREAGFNVSSGTFGSPYKVELGDGYIPVIFEANLPNYTEQEIIIIDLTPPETIDGPEGEKGISMGENDWWAKCSLGKIDPRPRVMTHVRKDFDRILHSGGLFVIFAQPRLHYDLVWAKKDHYLHISKEIPADNWSFLSILSANHFVIKEDYGEEIQVSEDDPELYRFLKMAVRDAKYTATFTPSYRTEKNWIPILSSKFRDCIGGLIVLGDSNGCVLILPQISKKPEIILTLLREILPDISPHLFPHIEGLRWVERDEYELDSILNYKSQKEEVLQRAKRELEELDKKISEDRDNLGFLYGILTKTGRDLVVSVKSCLEFIGFKKVKNVDEKIKDSKPKQEDLQVHDRSPILLVEIKGLSGFPRESDTLQVEKYVARRMKELDRHDIHAVSIINHQRNIPALERDNKKVFTKQQIEDAENHGITILTTWDLFRLIRGMLKWKWDPKAIQKLFYNPGRIHRFPTFYEPIGKIVKYWEEIGVVGLQVSGDKLRKGQRIGYIIPEGYLEEEILSLQVEKQNVEEAVTGQLAGIKTIYSKNLLRKGTIVCLVKK